MGEKAFVSDDSDDVAMKREGMQEGNIMVHVVKCEAAAARFFDFCFSAKLFAPLLN